VSTKRRVILIAGPTASGKSALAVTLAKRLGGAVINADSMQVYGDLRVITARPTPSEEACVPHLLFGQVDAGENYSVARWLADVRQAIAQTLAQGLQPIVTGGTGLYFKALTQGLSDMPMVPDDLRQALRAAAADTASEALHAALAERDPVTAATLRPSDRQRVLRALEVLQATGKPLSSFQGGRVGAVVEPGAFIGLFLAPERQALYRRIDARFDRMVSLGALDEVRALASRGLDATLPAMRAHGVPWLMRELRGEISLADAMLRAKADTRHYAKRQFTWFRHQGEGFAFVAPEEAESIVMGHALGSYGR
jgi:tRNA dimethylallyltransferase